MTEPSSRARPTLLYLVTEDWFFCSHFLERACAAQEAGYSVIVATRDADHAATIRARGLTLVPIDFDRSGRNPFRDIITITAIRKIYRQLRPDIVHHIALKPILYGTLVARALDIPAIINAPVGLGNLFTATDHRARMLRVAVKAALKRLLNPAKSHVIFENADDRSECIREGMAHPEASTVIPGAGIAVETYRPVPEPSGAPLVMLAARMLWHKGVADFVAAAKRLRTRGIKARFMLAGGPDTANPAQIPVSQLQAWHDEGHVEWVGFRTDVPELLQKAHIFCLPTFYREGLPKAILEAMATARPVVTTDVAGCRDAIRHGQDGLLVAPKDVSALADALQRLIENPALRIELGQSARERAIAEFADHRIIALTLAQYSRLCPIVPAPSLTTVARQL